MSQQHSPIVPVATPPASWIQKTPGVCGGEACIRNTRNTVWGLVNYRKLGVSDDRLIEIIEGITKADLDTAWNYFDHNVEEIEETIRQNEEA